MYVTFSNGAWDSEALRIGENCIKACVDIMSRAEFVTPWARMKAMEELVPRIWYAEKVEPFADRHAITFFNNQKQGVRETDYSSDYDRLFDMSASFDPKQKRCDRTRINFFWDGIYQENIRHTVGMTSNHAYGRPNRVQYDWPERRYNRCSKTREFYSQHNHFLTEDEDAANYDFCY